MDYNVNPNDPNVSTTVNHGNKKDWDLDKVFEFPYTPENLFKTLQIVDGLKRKYPNDDIISKFEKIVRNEICLMFGGSIDDK